MEEENILIEEESQFIEDIWETSETVEEAIDDASFYGDVYDSVQYEEYIEEEIEEDQSEDWTEIESISYEDFVGDAEADDETVSSEENYSTISESNPLQETQEITRQSEVNIDLSTLETTNSEVVEVLTAINDNIVVINENQKTLHIIEITLIMVLIGVVVGIIGFSKIHA